MNLYRYIIGFIIILMAVSPANAQTSPLTVKIEVGYDGYYKINQWTPIRLTIENSGPAIVGELRLRDSNPAFGTPSVLYHYPVDLPNQSRKQFTLYLPLRGDMRLEVQMVDADEQEIFNKAAKMTPLAETQATLIGVMASDLSLMNGLAMSNKETGEQVAIAHIGLEDLPTTAQAWQGLDMLVFDDVDTSPLTPAQQAALSYWVSQGGQVIIGGGPNATTTLMGLQPILPFPSVQMVTLPHPLTSLQKLLKTNLPDRGPYPIAVPTAFTGEVMLKEQGQPLLIRHSLGQGQVDYFTLGLNLAPLDQILPPIFPQLIGIPQPQPARLLTRLNEQDILRSLTVMANQGLPNPALICLYLFIYVLIVGPITYIILRLLKRGEIAWLSIPAMVFLCTGVIYLTGFRLRGNQPILSQINVIEANSYSTLAETTSFLGVYSPSRANYSLKITNETALIGGLPDSAGVSNELAVTLDGNTEINNLRGDIGGMPAVMMQGQTVAPQVTGQLTYQREDNKISGEITHQGQQSWQNAAIVLVQIDAPQSNSDDLTTENVTEITIYTAELPKLALDKQTINQIMRRLNNQFSDFEDSNDKDTFYQAAYKSGDPILVSRDLILKGLFQSNTIWPYDLHYQTLQNQPEWSAYLVGWSDNETLSVADLTSHNHTKINQTLLLVNIPLEVK